MALLRIMSWTSLPYLPLRRVCWEPRSQPRKTRLRPCPNHPVSADIRWVEEHRGSTCVYHPRSPPPPPETRVSARSLAGTPVLLHTDLPAPSGRRWPSLLSHSQPTLRPQSRDAPGCKTPRKLRFDISKGEAGPATRRPSEGRGDREAPKNAHKRPTQQVLLKNGAELLFRQKGTQLPRHPAERCAYCPDGAEKVNQGASPHGLCGHQGAREVDAKSSPPSSTTLPLPEQGCHSRRVKNYTPSPST